MSNQRSRPEPVRVFAAFEAVARLVVPIALLAGLLAPVAMAIPLAGTAALGACIAGFTIIQIVRWINRREDPRHGRRSVDATP
jgi:hypothetical protein